MASLRSLTEDQKQQAFERAKQNVQFSVSGVKLQRVTAEYYNDALEFIRDYFLPGEPLLRASGTQWGDEAKGMHLDTLRHNISLMTVSETSGEIASLLTVQVLKKTNTHDAGQFQDDGLRDVNCFVEGCIEKANIYEHFGVDEVVHLDTLVTSKNHRQQGLASVLVKAAFDMVRHFSVGKVCVKAEGSSAYSKVIFEKQGMECLYEGMFDEYVRDGRRVFSNTGDNKSIKVYGVLV